MIFYTNRWGYNNIMQRIIDIYTRLFEATSRVI